MGLASIGDGNDQVFGDYNDLLFGLIGTLYRPCERQISQESKYYLTHVFVILPSSPRSPARDSLKSKGVILVWAT